MEFRWWANKQPSIRTYVSKTNCPDLPAHLAACHQGTERRRVTVPGAEVSALQDEGPWGAAGGWVGRRAVVRV